MTRLLSCCGLLFAVVVAGAAQQDKPSRVVFRLDTQRQVAMLRGDKMQIVLGRLDADGVFLEDRNQPPLQHPMLPSSAGDWRQTRESLQRVPIINVPEGNRRTEKVYEFRAGTLVLGTLTNLGQFTPEVGSTVIRFGDYVYGKNSLRIYNLPGRFAEIK